MTDPIQAEHNDISDMTFEAALAELETIVGNLERGDVDLDKSIRIYERGEALKAHCEALLKRAEQKIEKINVRADGTAASSEPLDAG